MLITNLLRFVCILAVTLLLGCASGAIEKNVSHSLQSDFPPDAYWSRVKFRINWDQSERPDFSLHPLIAQKILRPVLQNPKLELPLWRFHRRAAPDEAGHQFSFIFFSDHHTATKVFNQIEASPLITQLLSESVLKTVIFTDKDSDNELGIESTSDPAWPMEIQQSWPWFIMGVSQSWLSLISAVEENEAPLVAQANVQQMRNYYENVNKKLSEQWTRFGRHAYFHHINALFGYEPVYIHESNELKYF